jgi:hypothetical protein
MGFGTICVGGKPQVSECFCQGFRVKVTRGHQSVDLTLCGHQCPTLGCALGRQRLNQIDKFPLPGFFQIPYQPAQIRRERPCLLDWESVTCAGAQDTDKKKVDSSRDQQAENQ